MKRFQEIPHIYFVKIAKRSLSINQVQSSYSGKRQTRTTTVTLKTQGFAPDSARDSLNMQQDIQGFKKF